MKIAHILYEQITSLENLFQAWNEFRKGKRSKIDVQNFEINLEDNLFSLHEKLKLKLYKHASYVAFNIYDPKFRHIHKAKVADRIIHHAIVSVIEPIFDKGFIYDSYSCRKTKGMHKAVKRLATFTRGVSKNYTNKCFVLKLDIKKFFASVDHEILLNLLKRKIKDRDIIWLLLEVIDSFHSEYGLGKGIPIGNLTSQIFANIYLNELDKIIKQDLQIKYYIRYADDFIIVSDKVDYLKQLISQINMFLKTQLKLSIHQDKIIIRKTHQGIDFLGYIVLPYYILPRAKTKRRMFKKLKEKLGAENFNQSLQAYLGYLSHANSYKLQNEIASPCQV